MGDDRDAARGPVMLSLASRQAWPHILAAAHFRPSRLVLLHSADPNESLRPAERLKRFFDETRTLVGPGGTELTEIPDDDFRVIQLRVHEAAARAAPDGAGLLLNFTGGNKLMATAAFRWAERNRVSAFYLERGNRLVRFEHAGGDGFATSSVSLEGAIANELDPVALLECQSSASQVERRGQRLTLNRKAKAMSERDFREWLKNRPPHPPEDLLHFEGKADKERKAGDTLEFRTAVVLLALGVPEVRRSLRLTVPTRMGSHPHAELDLLFNRDGKLWLVDCKDRGSERHFVNDLRAILRRHPPPGQDLESARILLARLDNEMKISPIKALKEDLVAIGEIGGLLGRVVCVRKSPLSDEAAAYARENRIETVLRPDLFEDFRRKLHPGGPATAEDLGALKRHFAR